MADEVAEHLPGLAARRGLDAPLLLAALGVIPLDWQPPEVYEPRRVEAERRIGRRDPDDWPTVALALVLDLPIWSQDKDIQDAELTVYTTGELLDAILEAGSSPR